MAIGVIRPHLASRDARRSPSKVVPSQLHVCSPWTECALERKTCKSWNKYWIKVRENTVYDG
jgi:hypothetical protein